MRAFHPAYHLKRYDTMIQQNLARSCVFFKHENRTTLVKKEHRVPVVLLLHYSYKKTKNESEDNEGSLLRNVRNGL